MRLRRGLTAAFILILSVFSLIVTIEPGEPSLRTVLQLVIIVICFQVFLTFPVYEERWRRLRQQPREDTNGSPTLADPAAAPEGETPSPAGTLSRQVDETLSVPAPKVGLANQSPLSHSPVELPPSEDAESSTKANTVPPAPELAAAEPLQGPAELTPSTFKESIHMVLSKLDHVSTFAELLPEVEWLYKLMPEDGQKELPKRPRKLAEHLFITRVFAKSALTEEAFSELTDRGIAEAKRVYPDAVSVALLQDCKRERRWLENYASEIDAARHGKAKNQRK